MNSVKSLRELRDKKAVEYCEQEMGWEKRIPYVDGFEAGAQAVMAEAQRLALTLDRVANCDYEQIEPEKHVSGFGMETEIIPAKHKHSDKCRRCKTLSRWNAFKKGAE